MKRPEDHVVHCSNADSARSHGTGMNVAVATPMPRLIARLVLVGAVGAVLLGVTSSANGATLKVNRAVASPGSVLTVNVSGVKATNAGLYLLLPTPASTAQRRAAPFVIAMGPINPKGITRARLRVNAVQWLAAAGQSGKSYRTRLILAHVAPSRRTIRVVAQRPITVKVPSYRVTTRVVDHPTGYPILYGSVTPAHPAARFVTNVPRCNESAGKGMPLYIERCFEQAPGAQAVAVQAQMDPPELVAGIRKAPPASTLVFARSASTRLRFAGAGPDAYATSRDYRTAGRVTPCFHPLPRDVNASFGFGDPAGLGLRNWALGYAKDLSRREYVPACVGTNFVETVVTAGNGQPIPPDATVTVTAAAGVRLTNVVTRAGSAYSTFRLEQATLRPTGSPCTLVSETTATCSLAAVTATYQVVSVLFIADRTAAGGNATLTFSVTGSIPDADLSDNTMVLPMPIRDGWSPLDGIRAPRFPPYTVILDNASTRRTGTKAGQKCWSTRGKIVPFLFVPFYTSQTSATVAGGKRHTLEAATPTTIQVPVCGTGGFPVPLTITRGKRTVSANLSHTMKGGKPVWPSTVDMTWPDSEPLNMNWTRMRG